jgi:hypothetical protein
MLPHSTCSIKVENMTMNLSKISIMVWLVSPANWASSTSRTIDAYKSLLFPFSYEFHIMRFVFVHSRGFCSELVLFVMEGMVG